MGWGPIGTEFLIFHYMIISVRILVMGGIWLGEHSYNMKNSLEHDIIFTEFPLR